MIKEAAILHEGKLYTGKRHCNVIRNIIAETNCKHVGGKSVQGFITDTGEFVSREEAAKIALACGQIKALKFSTKELFSEDLY